MEHLINKASNAANAFLSTLEVKPVENILFLLYRNKEQYESALTNFGNAGTFARVVIVQTSLDLFLVHIIPPLSSEMRAKYAGIKMYFNSRTIPILGDIRWERVITIPPNLYIDGTEQYSVKTGILLATTKNLKKNEVLFSFFRVPPDLTRYTTLFTATGKVLENIPIDGDKEQIEAYVNTCWFNVSGMLKIGKKETA